MKAAEVRDIRCRKCGYSLKGLTNHTCPECGQTYKPDNPYTYECRPQIDRLFEFGLRPIGLFTSIATALASLLLIWVSRVPGTEESLPLLLSLCLLGGVLIRWLLHVASIIAYSVTLKENLWRTVAKSPVSLSAIPAALILSTFIAASNLPMYVAFRVSEKQLQTFAQHAMQSPPDTTTNTDQWVGLFHVEGYTRVDDGVHIKLPASTGIVFRCGFAYFPNKTPAPNNNAWADYTHYRGPWYIYKQYAG